MRNEFDAYRNTQATVHSWSESIGNKKFDSLELALGYCRHHLAHLSSIELFIHAGSLPEPIICGTDLEALVAESSSPHQAG